MGITYGVIVEHLFALLQQWQADIPEHHTHLLSSLTFALMEWRKTCLRSSASVGGMGGGTASTMLGKSPGLTLLHLSFTQTTLPTQCIVSHTYPL